MNKKKTALATLRMMRHKLTRQQTRTIRGQILSGEIEPAMRGMKRLCLNGEYQQYKAGDGHESEGSLFQV